MTDPIPILDIESDYDVRSWWIVFVGVRGFIGLPRERADGYVSLDPVFEYRSELVLQPGAPPGTVNTLRQRILVPLELMASPAVGVRLRVDVSYMVGDFEEADIETFQQSVEAARAMCEQLARQRAAERANISLASAIPRGLPTPRRR